LDEVERGVGIRNFNFRLFAALDSTLELCRTLRRQHAAWPAVEDAQPQCRVARGFPWAVEPVVLFLIPSAEVGTPPDELGAKLCVVSRPSDSELELRFDGAIS
jgi:hypothetical protein